MRGSNLGELEAGLLPVWLGTHLIIPLIKILHSKFWMSVCRPAAEGREKTCFCDPSTKKHVAGICWISQKNMSRNQNHVLNMPKDVSSARSSNCVFCGNTIKHTFWPKKTRFARIYFCLLCFISEIEKTYQAVKNTKCMHKHVLHEFIFAFCVLSLKLRNTVMSGNHEKTC